MERRKSVVILGTGGTIAGVAEADTSVHYRSAQLGVGQLLQAVPGLDRLAGCALQAEQIAQLDSKDMDHTTWHKLALRCAQLLASDTVAGIVITHGTDTLEETAWFLQCVLQPVKPVVLTCAMRPSTALSADGPANVRDAVVCAVDAQACGRGVLVVAAGAVWGARQVRKVHPYRLHAFDAQEGSPFGWVEEGRVRWAARGAASCEAVNVPPVTALPDAAAWPQVEIVLSHAGGTGAMVQALCTAGVRGLVVAGTGNGTLHHALHAALVQAQERGVAVRRTTRCEQGQVVQAPGADDSQVSALPAVKARISLMLELMGWPRTDRA